ncbi:MAG TPA: Type 1 glutamine amidotransferase-like domain-containing protein [bacterium]|nr:Type 1 glutamine amidotransferase-like domain-containing protein [bacterium]HPT30064.1 Type 1 glutamine amidotransferase-like domain-containing protein [bacterium]
MKTLLLLSSSRFLKNDLAPYLGRPLSDLRVAHVITASKNRGTGTLDYLDRTRTIFKENNCYFEDIDLDGKNKEELRDILKKFDVVFVNGGNTFYLLKSIRESEFDKVLEELLPQGLIYIGASAGAYVACPTIEMALWPHQDRYDHCGVTDFTGLNLVPFLITAHYVPEYDDVLREKIPQAHYPTRILDNEQALLVKDDRVDFLGGEETKL